MSHLMKNGQPCARPDGHKGQHRSAQSAEAAERQRRRCRAWHEANKERDREYRRAYYEANKDQAKEYARAWAEAHEEQWKATRRAYREASKEQINSANARHRERRRTETPFDLIPHGANGRRDYGCRCDICMEAHRVTCRRLTHLYEAETIDRPATAERRWQPWTDAEWETVARADLTLRQIARMLNRTYYAVNSARYQLKLRQETAGHHEEETAA